jgi:hypothetical protein
MIDAPRWRHSAITAALNSAVWRLRRQRVAGHYRLDLVSSYRLKPMADCCLLL